MTLFGGFTTKVVPYSLQKCLQSSDVYDNWWVVIVYKVCHCMQFTCNSAFLMTPLEPQENFINIGEVMKTQMSLALICRVQGETVLHPYVWIIIAKYIPRETHQVIYGSQLQNQSQHHNHGYSTSTTAHSFVISGKDMTLQSVMKGKSLLVFCGPWG